MSVGLTELAVVLAVVGLRLAASAYPDGTAYRDDVHRRVGQGTRLILPPTAPWRTEVPFPNPGDLRSWDAMSVLSGLRVGFEFETRPRDGQELLRKLNQKRRDGAVDRLVLVLADSRSNRRFLRVHGREFEADFPTPASDVVAALREGRAPGDGVVLVRPVDPAGGGTRPQPDGRRSRRTGVGSG